MDDLSLTRAKVAEFEAIIDRVKSALWADAPLDVAEHFLKTDPVLAWRLLDLFDAYLAAGQYPEERLPGLMDRLIDSKLELYFVSQVLPGTENAMVYLRGFDKTDPLKTPGLQLARLCYSQAIIGQSRVLWERLTRSIYFLETGRDPDGKSVRRRFFGVLADWSPRWDLLAEFESEINRYDQKYRTPEYHKGSVLRRELLGGEEVDANDLLSPMTPLMNGLWPVMMANVQGSAHNILRLGRRVRPDDSDGGPK